MDKNKYTTYLQGLVEIGERIKQAREEKNQVQVQNWFSYLQGYIEALSKF